MFWICRRHFLDLSTTFFGLVNKIFWICQRNFLDLSTIFFGFVNDFFLDLSTIFLDLSTKFGFGFGFATPCSFVDRKESKSKFQQIASNLKICNVTMTLTNDRIVAWVTRPERPKGTKDEVKPARRATK